MTIPVRLDKKKQAKGKEIVLNIYDAIFLRTYFNRQSLIDAFTRTIRALELESQGLNITLKNPQYKQLELIRRILMMNRIIQFLESIQSITPILNQSPGKMSIMESVDEKNKAHMNAINEYWANKQIYQQDSARSLFLLGIMVSDVSNAQYKKLKSEPILKKINFDGMNRDRIIELTNEVVDRLDKYKKFYRSNKIIHSQLMAFFEKVDPEKWPLNPAENVFYLMSGYAFNKQYWYQQIGTGESSKTEDFPGDLDEDTDEDGEGEAENE